MTPGSVWATKTLAAYSGKAHRAFTRDACDVTPTASLAFQPCPPSPFPLPAMPPGRKELRWGVSPGNPQGGEGLQISPGPHLSVSLLLLTPFPPSSVGLGEKTADFAAHSPRKSPSMACCYASRTQDCELEIVSPLSPLGRSLELGETAERYKSQRRGRAPPPFTPDGLPDSYPFPWQKISFCYCWLGRSTEECARIYCPMHHWPNCLRNPSSRTFHRWL